MHPRRSACMSGALLLALAAAPEAEPRTARSSFVAADAAATLRDWLARWRAGRIDLHEAIHSGLVIPAPDGEGAGAPRRAPSQVRYYGTAALDEFAGVLREGVAAGGLDVARALVDGAVTRFAADPAEERRRFVERQPWLVRRLCAEHLARIEDPAVGRWLRGTVLTDNDPVAGERRRAVAALVLGDAASRPIPDEERAATVGALAKRLADPSPLVRANAAEGLGRIGAPAALAAAGAPAALGPLPLLEERLEDPDAAVRLEALRAIAAIGATPEDREAVLRACFIALRDADWAVRWRAAVLLGGQEDARAIPALVAALQAEAPGTEGARRRVRSAIRRSLGRLTGQAFPSDRPEEWNAWWKQAARTFAFAAAEERGELPPEQGARFFGIPLEADVVLFLLDTSGSMDQPATSDRAGPSRLYVASRELVRCLRDLDDGTRFNVVTFDDAVRAFRPRPVVKSAETVAAAQQFLGAIEAGDGTNLFDALEFALGLDARAAGNDGGDGRDDVDTLVLLTDGVPSRGPVLLPEEIVAQVTRANRREGVVVHTVATGRSIGSFLEELARENGGQTASIRR